MGGIKSVNGRTMSEMCLVRYAPGYQSSVNP